MAQVEIIAANLKTAEKSIKKTLKKVCAYARVSTDSEEQLTSYKSQIKHYSEYIKSNPEWEFVGIYADEGISGTQVKNRTEFQRMIDDALSGKIDIIIAKSISRFARNTVDTLNNARLLREHNIDVYFEKENIHTLLLDSEMFLTLYSAFAQAESESLSMNVKLGLKAKMKRGEFVGNVKCYGYDWIKETKELKINEEQAEVVRQIFNWYINGIGSYTIAKKLNEEQVKTNRGGKWTPSSVRQIIRNEKYVGDLINQKKYSISPLTHKKAINLGEKEKYYSKDHHQPIISREVWDKAKDIYSKRSKEMIPDGKQHGNKFSKRYPFSSKIYCGICGNTFVRRISGKRKDDSKKIYWSCSKRITNIEECSKSIFIEENILKSIFIQIYNYVVKEKHKTKDKLFNAIKNILDEDNNKGTLNNLRQEKQKLEKRLSNLIDMKLDDYENKSIYTTKENEINEEIKKINVEISNYETSDLNNKNIIKQLDIVEKVFEEQKNIKEFDETLFENLVDKIIIGEIDKDGNINENVINFILKIGSNYKYEIDKTNNNENVSFRTTNLEKIT